MHRRSRHCGGRETGTPLGAEGIARPGVAADWAERKGSIPPRRMGRKPNRGRIRLGACVGTCAEVVALALAFAAAAHDRGKRHAIHLLELAGTRVCVDRNNFRASANACAKSYSPPIRLTT